jgi:hypothetical protein
MASSPESEPVTDVYGEMLTPLGEDPSNEEQRQALEIARYVMKNIELAMSREKISSVAFTMQIDVGEGFMFNFGDLEEVPRQDDAE